MSRRMGVKAYKIISVLVEVGLTGLVCKRVTESRMDGFDLIEGNRRSLRRMNYVGGTHAGRYRSGDDFATGEVLPCPTR